MPELFYRRICYIANDQGCHLPNWSGPRHRTVGSAGARVAAFNYPPPSGAISTRHICQSDTTITSAAKRNMSINKGARVTS